MYKIWKYRNIYQIIHEIPISKGKSPDVSSFLGGLDGGWRKATREGIPVG